MQKIIFSNSRPGKKFYLKRESFKQTYFPLSYKNTCSVG